jgi:hypothetical protein
VALEAAAVRGRHPITVDEHPVGLYVGHWRVSSGGWAQVRATALV